MNKIMERKRLSFMVAGAFALFITGCAGPAGDSGSAGSNGVDGIAGENGDDGLDGEAGVNGTDGTNGTNGTNGSNGTNGATCNVVDNGNETSTITCSDGSSVVVSTAAGATNVQIPNFHGIEYLQTTGEFGPPADGKANLKQLVDITIDSATASAAGVVVVEFTVKTKDGQPFTTLDKIAANIAKLVPDASSGSNNWVPYIYGKKTTATVGEWNSAPWSIIPTAYVYTASSESSGSDPLKNGEFTNNNDGTYRYEYVTNISALSVDGVALTYDQSLTHRVSVMAGGHAGATGSAVLDFVPSGGAITEQRNIVETATCQGCHGPDFHGHGGNRTTVENCVTCHNAGVAGTNNVNLDAQSRESMDMKVMLHKIHAGGKMASIAGADGEVFDNPDTLLDDESADNGQYVFWGHNFSRHDWAGENFPARIENCTKCHQGTGAQVDNWKSKPSRAACGSCHDDVDFVSGVNHTGGGGLTDDSTCSGCHKSDDTTNTAFQKSISLSHAWTTTNSTAALYDARNLPEFDVAVTLDTPARGYYIAGESPKVFIKLTDRDAPGVPIDHSSFAKDAVAEGCLQAGCPALDGAYTTAYAFVSGPRGDRNPVLTTKARAQVMSSSSLTASTNLSAAVSLILKVDQGLGVMTLDENRFDKFWAGTITVKVADGYKTAGIWPNGATVATLDDIAAWLNNDANFKARAIAAVEGGKLGVRSRNLGKLFAIQLQASGVATAVFGGDVTVHNIAAYYASNELYQHTDPATDDPKVSWTTDAVVYQLDPVDDLKSGTYVAVGYIADRGRVTSGVNFKATSVGLVTFQVKTGTIEKAPAENCASCHQAEGKGLVFHGFAALADTAVDLCGSCHDYQPMGVTGLNYGGAHPISKRIHAVHNGSALQYPNTTVAHSDEPKGRNWDITFPQDIRNCQSCHSDDNSSGSWANDPARLPCMGCHDKDAATAHMKIMTYDPTPADAWSGDEEESCKACH